MSKCQAPSPYIKDFEIKKKYIYLLTAAVCALPRRTVDAMARFSRDMMLNGCLNEPQWKLLTSKTKSNFAKLLGCYPEEIAFVKNTSAGLSLAAWGLPIHPGENVVVPKCEFPSNVYPWLSLKKKSVDVKFVDIEPDYSLPAEKIINACDENTKVVAISFVEFLSGWKNDLKTIGKFCRKKDIYFVVDAIQGLGAIKLNVLENYIDILCADSHKWLLGPEGIAVFYASNRIIKDMYPTSFGWHSVKDSSNFTNINFDLREDASVFEEGSPNTIGIYGVSESLKMILDIGIDNIEKRNIFLASLFRKKLLEIGFDVILKNYPVSNGIVAFFHPQIPAKYICAKLAEKKIILSQRGDFLRASFHFFNDEKEIEKIIYTLKNIS